MARHVNENLAVFALLKKLMKMRFVFSQEDINSFTKKFSLSRNPGFEVIGLFTSNLLFTLTDS